MPTPSRAACRYSGGMACARTAPWKAASMGWLACPPSPPGGAGREAGACVWRNVTAFSPAPLPRGRGEEESEDRVPQPPPQRPRQERRLLRLRQHRPPGPDVVADPLDLAQDAEAAADEQLDVGAQRRRHPLDQREAAVEQVA